MNIFIAASLSQESLFWTVPPVEIVEEDVVEPSRHLSLAQQPIIGLEEFTNRPCWPPPAVG